MAHSSTRTSTVTHMRAAVIDRFGGPEVVNLARVPLPRISEDGVLVRVRASTVSAADRRLRSRDLPKGMGLLALPVVGWRRPRRRILGMDFAGVVESIGPKVTMFRPGDDVVGLSGSAFGGHAEFLSLPETQAISLKPTSLGHAEAVALMFGGHTMSECVRQCPIGPGDAVLVNGASGAVGSAAVQVARALGAEVTAVTSAGNAALARSLGAHHVIDYATEDFARGSRQYDVIIDCVGNAPFERSASSVKPGGALLLVAISDLKAVLSAKSQSRRSGLRVIPINFTPSKRDVEFAIAQYSVGAMKPVVDSTYDLEQIRDAHRKVDAGRKLGGVVIHL